MKIWWLAHCIITLHSRVESCNGRQQHLDNKCNKQPTSATNWKMKTTNNNQPLSGDNISIVGMHHQHPSLTTSIIINNNHYQQHNTYSINNRHRQPPQTPHCHFGWTWGINNQCVQTSIHVICHNLRQNTYISIHMCNLSHFEAKYTAEGN